MYTVNIGGKAMWVIDWLRCKPVFDHHLNSCVSSKDKQGINLAQKDQQTSYVGSHLELIWALQHAQDLLAPNIKIYYNSEITDIDVRRTTITVEEYGGRPGKHKHDMIIGADGTNSIVRRSMVG
jgi:hypothetical protein